MIEIFLALIAGILTIAAPCILLPLPILLGSSLGQKSKARPLFITLGFVITFAVLGIGINFIVQHSNISADSIRHLGAGLLLLFALFMIWPTPFERLTTHLSRLISSAGTSASHTGTGNFGGFLTGVIIGIVWAPCAGPILGSILTLIAQEMNFTKALGLLIAYSIGAGIPMLAIAYGGQAITTRVRGLAKYATRLQQVFGALLILLAVAIYFQQDTIIQQKILNKLPSLGGGFESRILCKFDFYVAKGDECEHREWDSSTTPTTTTQPKSQSEVKLENLGPAPEFAGIENWLNTNHALTMQELHGKVVLVDFWTYSCINCVRTLPYVTKWYDTYKDKGFVVIGVHTPEFAFEKDAANVTRAIGQHNIHYPVAQDNNYGTWSAYNNHYWPAEYLIDQNGNVVHTHFGEGEYNETEMAIKQLLGLTSSNSSLNKEENQSTPVPLLSKDRLGEVKSPEMYFGLERLEYFGGGPVPREDVQTYVIPNRLKLNTFALEGQWKFDGEKATLVNGPGKIKLHFNSAKVHMVANSNRAMSITAKVDNYPATTLVVQGSNLYTLFNSESYGDHVLEITIPEAGFEAFTFTFG